MCTASAASLYMLNRVYFWIYPKYAIHDVLISQSLDKIAAPFQRLSPHFWGPETQWHY